MIKTFMALLTGVVTIFALSLYARERQVTTYADGLNAHIIPYIETVKIFGFGDTLTIRELDVDSVPQGTSGRKLDGDPQRDSAIYLTYVTIPSFIRDSAQIDSFFSAWGVTATAPYLAFVPKDPISGESPLLALGISTAESTLIADIFGFPYLGWGATTNEIPLLATVDSLFEFWSNTFWPTFRAAGISANFYSRAKSHYGYWWRNGDTTWLRRADTLTRFIDSTYWQPNQCALPPRQVFTAGWWLYNATNSNDSSVIACGQRHVDPMRGFWDNFSSGTLMDGRIQGRTARATYLQGKYGPNFVGQNTGITRWDTLGPFMVDSLFSFHKYAVSRDTPRSAAVTGFYRQSDYCFGMTPFMIAHEIIFNFYRHRDFFRHTQAIGDSINKITKATLDIFIDNWGFDEERDGVDIFALPFTIDIPDAEEPCPNASETPSAALNMLIAPAFAAYYNRTGETVYADWVDSLTKYGIEWNDDGWSFNNGKEYNQSYYQYWQGGQWLSYVLLEPNSVTYLGDNQGAQTIDISWIDTNNTNALHMTYYQRNNDDVWVLGDTIPVGVPTYQFTGLPSTGAYQLGVTALIGGRQSAIVEAPVVVGWF